MKPITVYLAGDIASEDRWRPRVVKACEGLNVIFLSPLDNIDYRYSTLKKANLSNRVFLHCDYKKIDMADVVFAYVRSCKSRHSGTSAEIGYARSRGKLVLYVNDMKKTERYLYEFIERTADVVFNTFPQGIDYLQDYLVEMDYEVKEERDEQG